MDYDNSTFNEGVSPGGLRSTTQIKLLLEYLASALEEPLTREVAVEALTTHMLANYFETVQAIEELLRNGSLVKGEKDTLLLTDVGRESLGELYGEIPASVGERALADAASVQLRKRIEGSTVCRIEQAESGYNVICRILHKDNILMELTLHAVDYEQADKIRNSFNDNTAKIYGQIISMLY